MIVGHQKINNDSLNYDTIISKIFILIKQLCAVFTL